MPRVIVQNRIPRVKIGNRPIAIPPSDQGGGVVIGFFQEFRARAGSPVVPFIIPATGRWKFITHGLGEQIFGGTVGGYGGAYAERTRFLAAGARVTVQVGVVGGAGATIVTWPDGTILYAAGGGDMGGGDVMYAGGAPGDGVNGSPGGGPGGGPGGAAAGGAGGGGGGAGSLQSPGGVGGSANAINNLSCPGGGGILIVGSGTNGSGCGLASCYFVG